MIADDVRHFASPECLLGFVPAWGATQLAPRLIGPEAAVKLIVANPMRQNKMLNAAQAHELGLVDRVVAPERLIDEAITIALEQPAREEADLSARRGGREGPPAARRLAARSRAGAVPGARPDRGRPGAGASRTGTGPRRRRSPTCSSRREAQASLYAFDLVERRARRGAGRPSAEPRERDEGRHRRRRADGDAARDALPAAGLGVPVVLRDLEQEIVDRALETIRDDLAGAAARGRLDHEHAVSLAALAKARRRTRASRTATS